MSSGNKTVPGASTGSATGEEDGRPAFGKKGWIADPTGGLGVDSWAFREVAEEMIYNEMNPELAAVARHHSRFRERIPEQFGVNN